MALKHALVQARVWHVAREPDTNESHTGSAGCVVCGVWRRSQSWPDLQGNIRVRAKGRVRVRVDAVPACP